MRTAAVSVLALGLNLLCAGGTHAQDSPSPGGAQLQAGIAEFRAGAFTQALEDFRQAHRAGLDTPVLHYNLGSTYYKLGRDAEAAEEFKLLLTDPKFGEFARYNLGLIARRGGHADSAREYFAAVAADGRNPKLRALAQAGLQGRPARLSAWQPSSWYGSIEAGGGYDDNVALVPRVAPLAASGRGSPMYSAFVGGGGRLMSTRRQSLWVAGSVHDERYPQQSTFDLLVARAGPEYRFPLASWRIQTRVSGTYIRLGSNELETLAAFNLRGEHAIVGGGRLQLDYTLDRMSGGTRYGYLTGYQNQFGVHARWRPGSVLIAIGPTLTLNHRQDFVSGSQFFSVSPARAQIDASLRWNATLRTTYYAWGSYWYSRYNDPNVFLQGGALVARRRADTGYDAEIGMLYWLTSHARLAAEYGLRSNSSNISRYTYTTNRYMLKFQYLF